ncbi:Succinate semialdehyde dehydrogenase [NAD(P)+]|nr:Succinate semialdehyde dehydrogenase [NAD(P)+] [Candidatus Pantoea persica]
MQSPAELDNALSQSADAYRQWRNSEMAERLTVLRQREPELSCTITLEIGKPVAQARAEILKCAALCDWYAEHGPAMLVDQPTQVANTWQRFKPIDASQLCRGIFRSVRCYVVRSTCCWQAVSTCSSTRRTLMGSATLMAELFAATDLPEYAFTLINVDNDGVSAAIKDPRIAAVAVTGSVRAGAALKKTVLELGGADPFIVLADANLDEAVKSAVTGRYQNARQVCMAAKRFIVEAAVVEEFEARFSAVVQALTLGDPLDENTFLGPMARFDLRDELHQQVERSLQEGARLVLGDEKIVGVGNHYALTILSDVTNDMTAFSEEMFGPVAAIAIARDADHALAIANDSEFGLRATVWSDDSAIADRETGAVFINGNGASDPRVTIGGVKKSGYGRELPHFDVHEFCNIQTVWKNRH